MAYSHNLNREAEVGGTWVKASLGYKTGLSKKTRGGGAVLALETRNSCLNTGKEKEKKKRGKEKGKESY